MSRKTQRRAKSAHRTGRKPPAPLIARDVPDSGPDGGASEAGNRSGEDPPAIPAQARDLVEEDDDLLDVGYDLVLAAPPRERIECLLRIEGIVKGRVDLPMLDSDWEDILLEDDED